ncbi:hypothetical protein ACH61_01841 [Rathayibacter tanaceti]|uniref:Uncharacterized protein n=1 Tax=Rathayibacter tanaceti TaxID=1671680 RepID=A0A166HRL0_9MICO|nr:hypothetical protein ACH61_01841 [Rathayibacter tanaceti]
MPRAQERQRLGSDESVSAGVEVEAGVLVLDRRGDADVDSADRVRHLDDPLELDQSGIGDVESGELLDRLHRAGQPAGLERGVDLGRVHRRRDGSGGRIGARRDRHVEVAREADHLDGRVIGRDVHQHRDVVEVLGAVSVRTRGRSVGAVAAREQDVHAPLDRADLGRGVTGVDAEIDGGARAARDHRDRDGDDADGAEDPDAHAGRDDPGDEAHSALASQPAVPGSGGPRGRAIAHRVVLSLGFGARVAPESAHEGESTSCTARPRLSRRIRPSRSAGRRSGR